MIHANVLRLSFVRPCQQGFVNHQAGPSCQLEKFELVLDPDYKTFLAYMSFLILKNLMYWLDILRLFYYSSKKSLPSLLKYLDFLKFCNRTTKAYWHKQSAIDLIESKQILYSLIYRLGLVEQEILKTYIKINFVNRFIRLYKSKRANAHCP